MATKPATTENKIIGTSVEDRVYIERVRIFFRNATGNVASAIVGALFIVLVILKPTNTPDSAILIWLTLIAFFSMSTVFIEQFFRKSELTIENASRWVYARIIPSSLIGLIFGLTPFLFAQYLSIQEEMFLFIILSAIVSVAVVGYTTMPYYYTLLNGVTMVPLTLYFLSFTDSTHYLLAVTSIIWQFLLISKGWKVSKSSIAGIALKEQLSDEIEHHKITKQQLHKLATHDVLTGLPNRRLLMDNLDSMIAMAHRYKLEIAILFIDLDGFKSVNDTYGHDSGDFLLKEVSNRFKHHIRESDTLARMGGDEFIFAFIEIGGKPLDTEILANRILNSISEPILLPNSNTVQIGASIGIALFPGDGDNPENLIRMSDAAMYTSKAKVNGDVTYANQLRVE